MSERRSNELFLIFPRGIFHLFAELLDFLESQVRAGVHFRYYIKRPLGDPRLLRRKL